MKYHTDGVLRAVILFAIIAVLIALGVGNRRCNAEGGTYVRGLLWMECVK